MVLQSVNKHDEMPASVWHQLLEKLAASDSMPSLSVSCKSVFVFIMYEALLRCLILLFKLIFSHKHLKHIHCFLVRIVQINF